MVAERYVAIHWGPRSRSLLSNTAIPCIHADPLIDDLTPGSTVVREAEIIFHDGPLSQILPTAPVALATASPLSVVVGQSVNFNGSGSQDADGTIAAYSWDFVDGSALQSGASPIHSFASPGTYDVTLAVTDNMDYTDTDTVTVTVGALDTMPPVVALPSVDIQGSLDDPSIDSLMFGGFPALVVAGVFSGNVPAGSVILIVATDAAGNFTTRTLNVRNRE